MGTTSKLKKGQVPFDELIPPLRTAHDVRRLRACQKCGQMGHSGQMVCYPYDNKCFHGRCFVEQHGFDALAAMPEEARKLTLGDLGVDLTSRLIPTFAEDV